MNSFTVKSKKVENDVKIPLHTSHRGGILQSEALLIVDFNEKCPILFSDIFYFSLINATVWQAIIPAVSVRSRLGPRETGWK